MIIITLTIGVNTSQISFVVALLLQCSNHNDAYIKHRLIVWLYLASIGNVLYMHFNKKAFKQIYAVLNSS